MSGEASDPSRFREDLCLVGSLELEAEGSATGEFACSEVELESLAEALNHSHPESISVAQDKAEEGAEE